MSFTVEVPTRGGTQELPFTDNDSFAIVAGVLGVREAETAKVVYYPAGTWVKVTAVNHPPGGVEFSD